MRCAFAEAAIARELSTHIFLDFYLFGQDSSDLSGLVKALNLLKEANPQEAGIIRCQLARACSKSEKANKVLTQAVRDVCDILNPWLVDHADRKEEFKTELRELFSYAMQLWQTIQRTRQGARAVMKIEDPTPTMKIWFQVEDSRPVYDELPLGDEHRSQAPLEYHDYGPLAILFPHIFVGKAGYDDKDLLCHGFALFHTQTAAVIARMERSHQQRTTVNPRRRSSGAEGRGQRRSIASTVRARALSLAATGSDISYVGGSSSQLSAGKADAIASATSTRS
jgi:hypothetical protein